VENRVQQRVFVGSLIALLIVLALAAAVFATLLVTSYQGGIL
jgi:hypothetical protein